MDALFNVIDNEHDVTNLFSALHAKGAKCPDGSCIQHEELAQVMSAFVPKAAGYDFPIHQTPPDSEDYEAAAASMPTEFMTMALKLPKLPKFKIPKMPKIPKKICHAGCDVGAKSCEGVTAVSATLAANPELIPLAILACEEAGKVCRSKC